jgi:hypothetical protein
MIKGKQNKESKSPWIILGFMVLFFILSQTTFATPHFYHHTKVHSKTLVQSYHKHCIKNSIPAFPTKKKSNNNRKITSFTSPSFHFLGYYAEATRNTILKKAVEVSTLYAFIQFNQGVNTLDSLRAPPISSFC